MKENIEAKMLQGGLVTLASVEVIHYRTGQDQAAEDSES